MVNLNNMCNLCLHRICTIETPIAWKKKPLITMHGYIIKRDLKNMIIYMRSSGDIKEGKKEKEIESARNR